MSADMDPDLALVRKLHLELNGSGRVTRGSALPPAKKAKREAARQVDETAKDTSSASMSGSGSGSGKVPKKEGTLRRLIKKPPNTDAPSDPTANKDGLNTETASVAAAKEALEPQASTKAVENGQAMAGRGGDVGSYMTADFNAGEPFTLTGDVAANLARAAASREKQDTGTRVKCFYMGYPYGLSFKKEAFESRSSLAKALQKALAAEYPVCPAKEMEMFAYDKDGKQVVCSPEDSLSHWEAAVKAAKRIYVSSSAAAPQEA